MVSLPSSETPWYTAFQRQLGESGLSVKTAAPGHKPEIGLRLCHYNHHADADVEVLYFREYQDDRVQVGMDAHQLGGT
ncbi:MAG: hypothetical protein CSA22_10100 [Deltaproteobacteria bacterium]|nr:MAG: hypothetical protein CSA22_10100 [Deltaproteobacteria bacterium]